MFPGFESLPLRHISPDNLPYRLDDHSPVVSTSGFAGAIMKIANGDVAQLGEHLVRNEKVGGSSPLISTIMMGQARCDAGALIPSGLESSSCTLPSACAPSSLALFHVCGRAAVRRE